MLPALAGIVIAALLFLTAVWFREFKTTQEILSTTSSPVRREVDFIKYQPYETLQTNTFSELVDQMPNYRGTYGIYIKNLASSETFEYNAYEEFYGASLYKLPLAMAVLKKVADGDLKLSDTVFFTPADEADGTGSIAALPFGTELTYEQLLNYLLKESDNTAQVMLERTLGKETIEEAFENYSLYGEETKFFTENNTSPIEIAVILENIYLEEQDVLDVYAEAELEAENVTDGDNGIKAEDAPENMQADDETVDQKPYSVLNAMKETAFDDRVHAGLDEFTVFSHKIGNWGETGTWHDCGILFKGKPVVVCVMSKNTNFIDFLRVTDLVGQFASTIR